MDSIIAASESTLQEWTNLAIKLFPDSSFEEEFAFHQEILSSGKEFGFLYRKDGKYVGFMNLSIRHDYVNGTDTSPVVFIEAIYVLEEYRRHKIGREFVKYAENFAKQKGIAQIASDCLLDNTLSETFHKNCGFIEIERVICFVKDV